MSRKSFIAILFSVLFSLPALALKVGDKAPSIDGLKHKLMTGELVEGSLLNVNQSGQYLVLEFFSTTCSACMENLPLVSEIKDQFQNNVSFKMIAIDRDENLVLQYLQNVDLAQGFDTVLDSKRVALKAYEVKYTPTTFVVSPEGKIVFKHIGVYEPETMEELKALLQK